MDTHDERYLQDVLALGDRQPVVATIAIYSQSGIKLVNPGARVTSALYERLVQHKLLARIEQCVAAENGVDAADLVRRAKDLLLANPRFERMCDALPRDTMLAAFNHAILPQALAFKLTMMREQRPYLYAHSIEAALIAVYLNGMSSLRIPDLALAATAGVLHDIGLLHVSPDILAPGRLLADADRRYLYSHPITGHLITREFLQSQPAVSSAILEHHERLDGSGYPRGMKGGNISELGKILMIADTGAAFLKSRHRAQGAIALRLLWRKFSPLLLGHLSRLFGPLDEAEEEDAGAAQELALRQLAALAEILLAWRSARAEAQARAPECKSDALLALLDQRVVALERSVLEAGLAADQLEAYTFAATQDHSGVQEMCALAREALWQLKDIVLEVRRHWIETAPPDAARQVIARWLGCADERINAT